MSVELVDSSKNLTIDVNTFSNTDAELAIIGCILWDNKNYEKVSDFLDENHFVDETNKIIYSTIKNLLDKNILVSPITLKNYLPEDKNNINKVNYLNQIKDSAPSTQNTYNYAKIIYDLYVKRNLVGIAHNIIQETDSNTNNLAENLIENAENDLYNLSQTGHSERSFVNFREKQWKSSYSFKGRLKKKTMGRWKKIIKPEDLYLCEHILKEQIRYMGLKPSNRIFTKKNIEDAQKKIHSSSLLKQLYRNWKKIREGSDKFPLNPLNPKTWGDIKR